MEIKRPNDKEIQKKLQKALFKRNWAIRLSTALDYNDYKKHGRGAQIANEMDVRHQTVRRWLLGEAMPTKEKQEQLSSLLNVNLQWLMFGTGTMLSSDASIKTGIPIILASEIQKWVENPDRTATDKTFIEMANPNNYLFALIHQGDAMTTTDRSTIPDTATLIIDCKDIQIKPENRYIIKFERYKNPICRLAKLNDTGDIVFVSTNPASQTIEKFNQGADIILGKIKYVLL